jgi:hypothetical protein
MICIHPSQPGALQRTEASGGLAIPLATAQTSRPRSVSRAEVVEQGRSGEDDSEDLVRERGRSSQLGRRCGSGFCRQVGDGVKSLGQWRVGQQRHAPVGRQRSAKHRRRLLERRCLGDHHPAWSLCLSSVLEDRLHGPRARIGTAAGRRAHVLASSPFVARRGRRIYPIGASQQPGRVFEPPMHWKNRLKSSE